MYILLSCSIFTLEMPITIFKVYKNKINVIYFFIKCTKLESSDYSDTARLMSTRTCRSSKVLVSDGVF